MDLTTVRTAIALSVISIAHAAHAQTGAPPTPPDAMSGVIRHVPAISLTFAVGQVAIEPRATAPIAEAGAVIRLHRHFALDLGAGHFQTRRSESFPGMVEHLADGTTRTLGPFGTDWEWDAWYVSALLAGQRQMGRTRLWIAAGALIRDNRGGQTDWYTTCSQPSFPRGCDYAKTTRRATPDTTTPRFAGGVDVNLAKGLAIFANLANVEDGPALQTGLRLAVRTTEDVAGRRVRREPSLPPRLASARLAAGQTVWIRTDDGAEHQGLLLTVSEAEFQLRRRGATESIPLDRIAVIERPDPLANGMRNGAIIGVLSGLGLAIGTGLFGGGGESPATGEGAALTLAGLGAGTLAGAAIDALTQRREVVYDARTSGRLTLRTIPMSGGGALRVQLRW